MVYIQSHRLLFELDSIRFIYNDIDTVEFTRAVDFLCGCIYGLTRSLTVYATQRTQLQAVILFIMLLSCRLGIQIAHYIINLND